MFFASLAYFSLHVAVPHPAPQGPQPGEVARIVASGNAVLKILPSRVHRAGMNESDRPVCVFRSNPITDSGAN